MSRFLWQYPAKVEPLEPSLVVEQNLDWLQPTNQPVRAEESPTWPPLQVQLEPSDYAVGLIDLDWLVETQQPVADASDEYPTRFDVPFVVEPTLHVPQNLDWLQQTNQPIFEAEFPTLVFVPGQFEPADYPELIDLDWLVETQQPLRDLPSNNSPYEAAARNEAVWSGALNWTDVDEVGVTILYTAANWGSRVTFYFEAEIRAITGTAYVRVYDITDGIPVPSSVMSTTSATFDRQRTSSGLALIDGHEYQTQVGAHMLGGDLGETKGGKLVALST